MTANATSKDRQSCLDAGMDEYISKPIAVDKLRAVLLGMSPEEGGLPLLAHDESGTFDYADALGRADQDVLGAIGQNFHDGCDQYLVEIAAAIGAEDSKMLSNSAHTLRGLTGYFNATRIANLARMLEGLSEQGDWQQATDINRQLQDELGLLKLALATHLELGQVQDQPKELQ